MPPASNDPSVDRPLSEIKAELFRALAHPARVRVLEVLAEGEQSVGDLAQIVGLEPSHLSQQLAILRRAALVTSRKEGSTVFYAVRDEGVVRGIVTEQDVFRTLRREWNA